MQIIAPLLVTLIPPLVKLAEKVIPGSGKGAEKRAWVRGMLDTLLGKVNNLPGTPEWAKLMEGPLEDLMDALIEAALDEMGM